MKIFSTLCCAAVSLCGAIYAQSTSDHLTVHFNSPVMVGETQFPAGDCDVQVMRGNSNNVVVVLRSQGGPLRQRWQAVCQTAARMQKAAVSSSTAAATTFTSTASCSTIVPAIS